MPKLGPARNISCGGTATLFRVCKRVKAVPPPGSWPNEPGGGNARRTETPPITEQSTERVGESRPVWEGPEAFTRQEVQDLLQRMLEEDVAAMLGADATPGVRASMRRPAMATGFGKPVLRQNRVRLARWMSVVV